MRASLIAGLLALAPVSALAQVNVRALSIVPDADGVAGQPINLVASFQSDDAQPMPAFRWRAYLTVGGVLDGAIPIGALVGPVTLPNDQPQVYSVSRALPANVSGTFTVAIVADFDEAVVETNEYDNLAIAAFTTHIQGQAPDLDITSGSASASALREGEPIDVSFAIRNAGQLAATFSVGAYLSSDAVISPSDLLIGTADVTVGAGASQNGMISGVVPAGTHTGDWIVGVIADPTGAVTESDETNNIFDAARLNVFADALSLDTETLPQGTLTIDYHVQLGSTGGDGHYAYSLIDGALPNGLTLSPDGVVAGKPIRTGSYDFTIEVASNGLTDSQQYSVEIASTFQPLRIVTMTVDPGYHRYPYQQNLVAGGGEPPYSWRLTEGEGALPPGLDLSTNGVISGIPSQLGTFGFSVTVEDRLGAIDALHFDMEVTPLATVLILNTEDPVGPVGQPFEYQLEAIGGVPPYRWEAASTPPPGLSVTEDGTISGTPTQVGVWPLRIRVTDSTHGGSSDTQLFEVDVQDDGSFHIVTESLPVGLVRSLYQAPIEAEGGTPPYRWSLGPGETLPEGFFLTQGDGTNYSTDTAVIAGRAFRPLVHGFSIVAKDAQGRTQTLPYAITIDSGSGSFDKGCICVDVEGGSFGVLILGLLLFLRRRR